MRAAQCRHRIRTGDKCAKVVRINPASEEISEVSGKKMENLVRGGLVDRSVALELLRTGPAVTIVQKLKKTEISRPSVFHPTD